MSATDKSKNKAQELAGKVEEKAGEITGDRDWRPAAGPTKPRAISNRPARRSRTPSSTEPFSVGLLRYRLRPGGVSASPRIAVSGYQEALDEHGVLGRRELARIRKIPPRSSAPGSVNYSEKNSLMSE
jgi:hypothetical protein